MSCMLMSLSCLCHQCILRCWPLFVVVSSALCNLTVHLCHLNTTDVISILVSLSVMSMHTSDIPVVLKYSPLASYLSSHAPVCLLMSFMFMPSLHTFVISIQLWLCLQHLCLSTVHFLSCKCHLCHPYAHATAMSGYAHLLYICDHIIFAILLFIFVISTPLHLCNFCAHAIVFAHICHNYLLYSCHGCSRVFGIFVISLVIFVISMPLMLQMPMVLPSACAHLCHIHWIFMVSFSIFVFSLFILVI